MEETHSELSGKEVIKKCEKLLRELYEFKDNAAFHVYGFGLGGPYAQWMAEARELDTSAAYSELAAEVKSLPGYLITLGLDYMSAKGRETSFARTFQTEILKAAKKAAKA